MGSFREVAFCNERAGDSHCIARLLLEIRPQSQFSVTAKPVKSYNGRVCLTQPI